jgi:nicotinamidase-related amidase
MPHNVELPKSVVDRAIEKRGRRNVFDRFEPATTALLVVDMQNFFVDGCAPAASIVPNINRLASGMRERGAPVIWIQMNMADGPDGPSKFPIYHDYFFSDERRATHKGGLTEGSHGHAIVDGLDVAAGETIVQKTRFSALIQGSSNLGEVLEGLGVENLVITGTLTNICCESTARDGMMIGYRAVMVSDANASRTDEDHIAGLLSVYQCFGDVRTTDEVLDELMPLDNEASQAAE